MQSNYFWMGDYIYPEGSHPHALYGRNSNNRVDSIAQTALHSNR